MWQADVVVDFIEPGKAFAFVQGYEDSEGRMLVHIARTEGKWIARDNGDDTLLATGRTLKECAVKLGKTLAKVSAPTVIIEKEF